MTGGLLTFGLGGPSIITFGLGAGGGGGGPTTPVTTYTLSGPTFGYTTYPSDIFTVALAPGSLASPVVITPHAADGSFSPSTVTLTDSSRSATFTYTPATTGSKTVSVTNDGGLINPASITFTTADLPDLDIDATLPYLLKPAHYRPPSTSVRPVRVRSR